MCKRLLTILVLVSLTMTLVAGCSHESPEGKVAETTPSSTESPSGESESETSTPSEPEAPSTLTMLSITEGDVFLLKAGAGHWVEAEVGMTLEVGDTVKSGQDSNAEITFFDGSTIELLAGTQIKITSLDIAVDTGSTTIGLRQEIGNSISRVEKLIDSASSYEVETPAGVAAVRGSAMTLNVFGDGTTWTTNDHGDIWFTAQGVALQIPEGRTCIVIPGQLAKLLPLEGSGGGDSFSPYPDIAITKTPDLTQAHEGDTITYTYTVTNPGNVPLSDVSVTDNKIKDVTYQSGDTNSDGRLDIVETWVFTATYTVTSEDENPLVNTAAAAGTDAWFQTVIAWTTASVTIVNLEVEITNPEDGDIITSRTITVTGTVSDPAITKATLNINGASHNIAVTNGVFSSSENVASGENIITVTATSDGIIASDTVTITVNIPTYGIRIELTWDTDDTDFDSHLIRPGGDYWNIPDDCFYQNAHPDWGLSGVTEDNPSLDQDDTDGYGPENITLEQPYEEGTYHYMVHYYGDHGHGPATVTVRIWINDVLVAEYSKLMYDDEVWDCAYIDWPSGNVTPG